MQLDLAISDRLLEKLRAGAEARGQDLNDYVVALLAESLALKDTALLVIDLQRGAFDGVRCPPVDSPERLIGNAAALVEAARAGGHPVVFVQHCEDSGEFEEGTEHWQIHPSLAPQADEPAIRKKAFSAFNDTDLSDVLEDRGIRNLVICGLQSEYCVSHTTKAALDLGYGVRVASDAHGTWPGDDKSAEEIRDVVNAKLAETGAILATDQRPVRRAPHHTGFCPFCSKAMRPMRIFFTVAAFLSLVSLPVAGSGIEISGKLRPA